MSRTVKAAVMVAPGKMEVQELPYPDHLEPGAAIVKMEMSGICGTDKHAFKGELTLYGGTESEQDMVFPSVHGHENAGIVVEMNDKDGPIEYSGQPLKVGDRVTNCPNVICGECWYCRNIHGYPYCASHQGIGDDRPQRLECDPLLTPLTRRPRRFAQPLDGGLTGAHLVFAEHHRREGAAGIGSLELRFEATAAAVQDDIQAGIAKPLGRLECGLEHALALVHDVDVAAAGVQVDGLRAHALEHAFDTDPETAGRRGAAAEHLDQGVVATAAA